MTGTETLLLTILHRSSPAAPALSVQPADERIYQDDGQVDLTPHTSQLPSTQLEMSFVLLETITVTVTDHHAKSTTAVHFTTTSSVAGFFILYKYYYCCMRDVIK